MKLVNNPNGAVKSEGRTSLEKANLVGLMQNCTLQEIADMYNISHQVVHTVLTNQLTKRNIGTFERAVEYTPDIITKSMGAWMNSKERAALISYKSII